MRSINISLPDLLEEFVQNRVNEGGYRDPSDYIKTLVEADHARQSQERLEALLLEGVRSGPDIDFSDEWFEKRRTSLAQAHGKPVNP